MVDSTRNARKFSFQERPAEVQMMVTITMKMTKRARNILKPYKEYMRLFRELDELHREQNYDETAVQAIGKTLNEEIERLVEKRTKALRKRRREEETESPTEQEDEVQRKKSRKEESERPAKRAKAPRKRREEESDWPVEMRAKAQRKRRREEETEYPTKQEDEVQRKKSRKEESERPAEKKAKAQRKRREEGLERPVEKRAEAPRKRREEETECQADESQRKSKAEEAERPVEKRAKALRKRRGEAETECPAEQADEVPKKKSRKEKAERPIEKQTKALRKRRGEAETECPAEQADEVPKKKSRKEKERPIEKRTKAPRKRRGEEDTECPTEQADEVPRKKSREEKAKRPAEKRAKAQMKRGREQEIEIRKQEIMERLIKFRMEEEISRLEKERMEKEARVPGCLYPESFIFHKRLGSGSQGTVMLATHIDSGKLVAVKIVKKSHLYYLDRDTIMTERQVMQMVMGHPYCTQLYATFQSEDHLFYVMEIYSGGDLSKQIESKKLCDLPTMRRLAAELLCGLQYVHSKGVIHGGVKPDNILLDCNGHVRLADFGIAITNIFGSETRTGEFGSELYMAPEISKDEPFDKAVDYFALGVTLFEAAFGVYPFNISNHRASICQESPRYPIGADDVLVDFLNKLLCKDQKKRKVYIANIRKHRFFRGINWKQLEAGETRAPFSACQKDLEEMTKTTLNLYRCLRYGAVISSEKQELFMGFSFMSNEWKAMQKKKTNNTRKKKKLN